MAIGNTCGKGLRTQGELIRLKRCLPPDLLLLMLAEIGCDFAHSVDALGVGTTEGADRPVAGEDQPFRAKEGQRAGKIGPQGLRADWRRLGQALDGGEFHTHIGKRGERPELLGPGQHTTGS
jgi:hypothetical protein